jgi:predicted type IV restriction endonuclease
MDERRVIMRFWDDPAVREVVRQVFIALLLALLSVLGYDAAIAKPRIRRLRAQSA